jgi:hypothetical protein
MYPVGRYQGHKPGNGPYRETRRFRERHRGSPRNCEHRDGQTGEESDKDQGELRKATEVWHGISVEIVF